MERKLSSTSTSIKKSTENLRSSANNIQKNKNYIPKYKPSIMSLKDHKNFDIPDQIKTLSTNSSVRTKKSDKQATSLFTNEFEKQRNLIRTARNSQNNYFETNKSIKRSTQFERKTSRSRNDDISELTRNTSPLNKSININKSAYFQKKTVCNKENHARNKTQSIITDSSEKKKEFKKKNLIKTNSFSNIFDRKSINRVKTESTHQKGNIFQKDKSVNVKQIDLMNKKTIDKFNKMQNFRKISSGSTEKETNSPLINYKKNKNQKSFDGKISFLRHYNLLKNKIKYFERKRLRKKTNKLKRELQKLNDQKSKLSNLNIALSQKQSVISKCFEAAFQENLTIKILFHLQNSLINKNLLNYDFLQKTPSFIIQNNEFQINESKILGKGGFAIVYEGKYKNEIVAIKKMTIPIDNINIIIHEILVMMSIENQNLVQLKAISISDISSLSVTLYIIMEYLQTDLRKSIFIDKKIYPKTLKLQILCDILKGLSYLHEKNYVHCDLKLQNILLDSKNIAKITDFGLSKSLRCGRTKNTHIIGYSERTSAFEYLCEEKVSTKADIWSFGILMYEILKEKISWENLNGLQAVAKISVKTPFFNCNQKIGNKFEDGIIEQCLNYDYSKRPSAKEILEKFEQNLKK